jgi:thioredoxin-related protein
MESIRLVRLNTTSRQGLELAQRFGVRGVPTLIVFDGSGDAMLRQVGRLNKGGVLEMLKSLQD